MLSLLPQKADIAGAEAYLRASEGPLFVVYNGSRLLCNWSVMDGFCAWSVDVDVDDTVTGYDTLQEALDDPVVPD